MAQPRTGEAEHQITITAPADDVFGLLAEVRNWPRIFPPTIYVDHLGRSGQAERIRIWATANGQVKSWTSRRVIDRGQLRIEFRQEVSSPPVAAMSGTWIIEPVSAAQSRVRLLHDYQAIDDDPRQLAWIAEAVDGNSRTELAALKANVELATGANERLTFSFQDTMVIKGASTDIYDFLNDAQHWQERLPHVARVILTEDDPGLQILEMDTRTADGSAHTTKSVRVCFPDYRIVYKQITLPALLTLHTGSWQLIDDGTAGGTVTVISQHTVAINEASITGILGAGAGVPEAREFIRHALSTNSLATLTHAKQYAEGRR